MSMAILLTWAAGCGPADPEEQVPSSTGTSGTGTTKADEPDPSSENPPSTEGGSASSDTALPTGSTSAADTGEGDECNSHVDCPDGQACETPTYDPNRCVDVECIDDTDCPEDFYCYKGTHHVDGGSCEPVRPRTSGFGYPVGDQSTWPAGGWYVTQVLGHYLNYMGFEGGHLAQDVAAGTEAETAGAPVYSIGDGEVLYAGTNSSTYVNVVLIRHDLGTEGVVCSFYGHLGSTTVTEGQTVSRGEQIATVLDWAAQFGPANSHLHYVVLGEDLCNASDAAGGALICGYDDTAGPNGIETLDDEPYSYTSVGDVCGTQQYPDAFISPSQFIELRHF